jgi:MFS family permease
VSECLADWHSLLLCRCYTVGSVIGPALGGWLGAAGEAGYLQGALVAVVGSLVSVVLALLMPEVRSQEPKSPADAAAASPSSPSWSDAKKQSRSRGVVGVIAAVWLFLSSKVITSVANATR